MRPFARRCALVAIAIAVPAGASPAVGTPSLDLTVAPRVKFGTPIFVRGVAGEAGRVVLTVRNANGRVIGRTVKSRVRAGAFGALVRLDEGARPGPATVSGLLTGAGAFAPVRDTARVELVRIEPNFLAAFPSPWPVGTPIPVKGRLAFPGRLVIVVRTPGGKPLGRAVVEAARKGPFTTSIRLGSGARPGPVAVTATLRSGSLIARGTGTLILR